MTETVYVVANPSGGNQGRMHSDKDCARLKVATREVLEKERHLIESHRVMCKWCSGEADPGDRTADPLKNKRVLLGTDASEVGP